MNEKPLLCLIDGAGYYFRAYYAINQHLSNSKGQPTNAVFGFAKMLPKILREQHPDYALMVFDSKEKTFRHDMYELYKANRAKMPEDLVSQLPYIDKICHAHNVPIARVPGYEADDIIGGIASKAVAAGYEVVIATSDKDLMQLVMPGVTLYDGMKEVLIGPEQVLEKFGVEPSLVTDVLGLMGDSSDNIPGVPGVGEKTAKALVQEMGSLENILRNVESLGKKKLKENLIKFADQARLSKELATIVKDAPLQFEPKKWEVSGPNTNALREIYLELEFNAMLKELSSDKPKINRSYILVNNIKSFNAMITKLESSRGFAIDTETTSLHPTRARLVGISFSCKEGEGYYLPIRHKCTNSSPQLDIEEIRPAINRILESQKIEKYGQNIKYDIIVLAGEGFLINSVSFDTMIASYLINPTAKHGLSSLAIEYLGEEMIEYEEICGKGAKQIRFDEVEIEAALDYAAEDADITYRLVKLMRTGIEKQKMEKLMYEVEIPLMTILADMEIAGVAIDSKMLDVMGGEIEGELKDIESKIFGLANEEFNISSPKQLGTILFDKLKLSGGKKTKTGYSTSLDVLEGLAAAHPLPELVLEYRHLAKLKNTYIDALPKMVNEKTGRIHSSFNQTVAATGRLSSSDPNLQNIPIRTSTGAKIRKAFVAPAGHKLVSADYSQIELRLLAQLSGEPALLEAFRNNEDIHSITAAEISGVPQSLVSEDMRRMAKTVNFGIIYGQTAFGLARELKISMADAQLYIDNYFARYPGIKKYFAKIITEAKRDGFVVTLLGRKRYLPDINAKTRQLRQFAERNAVNSPIQGSAADLIKLAMISISKRISNEQFKSRMVLQVHDELVFEVPDAEVDLLKKMVVEEMEGVCKLDVPLVVSAKVGENWLEAH
jgi:DNA polymerase-1